MPESFSTKSSGEPPLKPDPEALRQAKEERDVLITYVSTQNEVADPLTKRTSPQLNKGFYPKWGLVTLASLGGVTDSERPRAGPAPVSRDKKNK